jgi:hypothetical protein
MGDPTLQPTATVVGDIEDMHKRIQDLELSINRYGSNAAIRSALTAFSNHLALLCAALNTGQGEKNHV